MARSRSGEELHVVAIAESRNGGGYWLACDSGRVFSFGDARFHGSAGDRLSSPIVAMAATPDGKGYWLAASGGRVFGYGDADIYGSATSELHGDHIVAMVASPDGKGYWLVASERARLPLRGRALLRLCDR